MVLVPNGAQPERFPALNLPLSTEGPSFQVPADIGKAQSGLSVTPIDSNAVPPLFVDLSRASSAILSLKQAATQGNLFSLPAEAHDLMFKEFQEATTSGDVKQLNNIVNGWQETAGLYESSNLNTALESSSGFRLIHARLLDLLQEDEDEEEQTFPSNYAFNTALALLLDARLHVSDLPRANVTADETGGIRLQWISPKRQVRLVVPAENGGRQYLYFETEEDYNLEDNPSPTHLAERLRWFADSA